MLVMSRILRAAVLILAASILPAAAQQAAPPPAQEQDPTPSKPPAVNPSDAPAARTGQDLVGLLVFSSDGTRVGEVRSVNTGPDGQIVSLHVRTGGFLGFGGRIVAIPEANSSGADRASGSTSIRTRSPACPR